LIIPAIASSVVRWTVINHGHAAQCGVAGLFGTIHYADDELPEDRLSSADAYEQFNDAEPPTPTTEQATFSAFTTASD